MHPDYLPDILKWMLNYVEWIVGILWGVVALWAAYDVSRYGYGMFAFIILVNAALMYLVL